MHCDARLCMSLSADFAAAEPLPEGGIGKR
jgi:hypothetical protein